MRRLVGLLTLLIPAIAAAQPGAMAPPPSGAIAPLDEAIAPPDAAPFRPLTDPHVLALARGTHAAAARGDCVGARTLGSQIARLDPEFHRAVIKTDPVITHRPVPRVTSIVEQGQSPRSYGPERTGTPPVTGTILVGEFLFGGLFTIGGAIGGAYLGAQLETGCSDECSDGAIVGGFLGGTIMAAIGVNLVGDSGEADGSLGLAVAGAMLGGFFGIGAIVKSDSGGGGLFVLITAPTLGAMLGHNLHRTWKPQRARQPSVDRRMAILPSARIEDGVSFALTGGTF